MPTPRFTRILRREWTAATGLLSPAQTGTVRQPRTQCVAITVPAGTRAFRLIWQNSTLNAAALPAFRYRASTLYGDGANPSGTQSWLAGGFGASEQNGDARPGFAPLCPGNADASDPGQATPQWPASERAPAIIRSAMLPFTPLPRADGGPGHILFLRFLWPPGQPVLWNNFVAGLGPEMFGQQGVLTRGALGDFVTNPGPITNAVVPPNGLPFSFIECQVEKPGYNLIAAGDSQIEGHATTGDRNTFYAQAAFALSRPDCPVGVLSCAWGGVSTADWIAQLMPALPLVQPSALLIQGFSGNDNCPAPKIAENAAWQRARIMVLRRQLPAEVPIIVTTPMPRTSAYPTPELIQAWEACRAPILAMAGPGVHVLDVTPLVTDPERPNHWRAGFGDPEGLHGTDAAQAAMRAAFQPMLAKLLGIPG